MGSDVQSNDRMGSDAHSNDRIASMADAFVAARLTRLIHTCFAHWADTVSSQSRSVRRLSVRSLAKGPFRHWVMLFNETAVRRLRDAPMQDVSFFSRTVAIASSEIMRKDLRQLELRCLKAKRPNNLRSSVIKKIDDFSSLKKRCSSGKSGESVRDRADESYRSNNIDSAGNTKNRRCSTSTIESETPPPPPALPDLSAMSSASIKTLWGSVITDNCSQSTYLGQHARKKVIKKSI